MATGISYEPTQPSAADTATPSVAVVITSYNHAHFLAEAIESVLRQARPADDVLVVDDGSTDDPAAVVACYPGVRLIRQENRGLSGARNTGLADVRTDAVVFLDADDRLRTGALRLGMACLAANPGAGMVYGGYQMALSDWRPMDDPTYSPMEPDALSVFLLENRIGMHATVVYRRAVLETLGGFDEALSKCEDYDVYLRMARHAPIVSHPAIVADYRFHGANMSDDHRSMLDTVLDVHRRHAPTPHEGEARRLAWEEGRRGWMRFYTTEMMRTAWKAWWSKKRVLGLQRFGRAIAMSPRYAAPLLFKYGRRAVGMRLPHAVARGLRLESVDDLPLKRVRLGDLGRTQPISDDFGYARGLPVDRVYIQRFLERRGGDIAGHVLEVGDSEYSRRFGGDAITRQDVLHINPDDAQATIVGDLSHPGVLTPDTFDCLLITQTLHLIYDMRAAMREMHAALKPGGVLLITSPGISRIDRGEWGDAWLWSLTPGAMRRLLREAFGEDAEIEIESQGNVFTSIAFLTGLAAEEVAPDKFDVVDEAFPVIVSGRARKCPPA